MRYRIANSKTGFIVTVEDGDEILATVPTVTKTEAQALVRKAAKEGAQAILPAKPRPKAK
jgi:hypothetical protein